MACEPFSRYVAASHAPPSIAASTTVVIMTLDLRDIFFTIAQRGNLKAAADYIVALSKADSEQHRKFHRLSAPVQAGRIPSFSRRARSRAASGLPVVRSLSP